MSKYYSNEPVVLSELVYKVVHNLAVKGVEMGFGLARLPDHTLQTVQIVESSHAGVHISTHYNYTLQSHPESVLSGSNIHPPTWTEYLVSLNAKLANPNFQWSINVSPTNVWIYRPNEKLLKYISTTPDSLSYVFDRIEQAVDGIGVRLSQPREIIDSIKIEHAGLLPENYR